MIILPSISRTVSGNKVFGTSDFTGAIFFLDIPARSGTTPTLDIKFQYKDPISGNFVDMPGCSFAQKNAVGSDTLTIYPGVVATANRSVPLALGDEVNMVYTIGGTTPNFTFSVSMDELREG